MGLDFSHCDAHWSYSGFNRFRVRLAAEAGIALNCTEGFAYSYIRQTTYEEVNIYGGDVLDRNFMDLIGIQPVIKWDKVKDDIVPLLNHSDCDGILTSEECRKVAPRLRELVKDWPDNDYDKQKALELADGMELAASRNENLEFF